MASALFRFIAAAARNQIVANTVGTFALLVLFALGGFVLARGMISLRHITRNQTFCENTALNSSNQFSLFNVTDDIKGWWIWGYWISPLMYGQNAIVINEFLGHQWSHVML